MEELQKAFVPKGKIYLVPTHVADRYLNTQDFNFYETKGSNYVVVEEKEKAELPIITGSGSIKEN